MSCSFSFGRSGGFFVENRRVNLQSEVKNSAAADAARDFDAPAVLANNVLRHPQAETGALFPGREKRIEDARQIVFGDPDAAVAELNDDRRLQGLFVTRRGDVYL